MTRSRGRGPTIAKDINRKLVYQLIKQKRRTSRVEVANELRLNKNTVNSIVDEMLAQQFVHELGPQETLTPGRKPIIIDFNANKKWAIGIQLTSNIIHWTVTDLYAKPVASFSVPLEACSPEEVVDALLAGVEQLASQYSLIDCIGMCIGIPGLMDTASGRVISSSHLNWSNIQLLDLLKGKITLPLKLDNSVKLASLGESWHGSGQGISNFVYCYFGNGVGCGIMMNGSIVRGDGNAAGELGHIVVDPNGELCGCGNRGCLETAVSLPAIIRQLGSHVPGASRSASLERIIEKLQAGDPDIQQAFELIGKQIGHALSYVTNLLNPKLIILDGPLMDAADYLFPIISKQLKERCVPITVEKLSLVRSELFPLASCIGAAASAIQAWEEELVTFEPATL